MIHRWLLPLLSHAALRWTGKRASHVTRALDSTAPAADQQSIDDIVYQLRPGFYGLNVSELPYWLLGSSAVVATLTLVVLLCVCFKRRVLPRTPQAPTGRTTIALACPSSLGLQNPTDIVVCPSCSGSMHEAAFRLDPTAVTLWNLPLSRSLNPSPHLGAAARPALPRVPHASTGDEVAGRRSLHTRSA
ncbi:hypothetical protein MTO96_014450 [Rhipicephalus appendiculatus]